MLRLQVPEVRQRLKFQSRLTAYATVELVWLAAGNY